MVKEKEITIEVIMQSNDPKALIEKLAFEDALKLLETLVTSVERGSLSLEQSIASYEKGVALVDHLRGVLGRAEEKLKVLKKDKSGNIQVGN